MSMISGGFDQARVGAGGDGRGELGAVESAEPQKSPISNTIPEALTPTANSIALYDAATGTVDVVVHDQSPGDDPANDRIADWETSPSSPRTSTIRSAPMPATA